MGSVDRAFLGRAKALFAVLFLALAAAFAAPATAQNFTFNSVQIEGNQRIETGTILSYAGVTRGETITAGALNDAAQRIRATGLFASVDLVPRGGTLIITVVEYPTIYRINFEGNARLSDGELSALVRSAERRVYSPITAEQDVAALTQAYVVSGRVNATIAARIIERSDNRVDLVFVVSEGGVSEIERISFIGNRNYSERRLRGVLATKQAGPLRALISADTFIAERIANDREALTDFYVSRGYVDFQVQNVDVALTRARDAYLITINVQEGQRFSIGTVTVSSEMDNVDAGPYERAIRLRSGVYYSPVKIDTDIARLERLALRQGVDFLTVEPRITRNDRDLTLDIDYVLVHGDRLFVERIDIEGNNTTLDRVIRNQFTLVEGDPFNPRAIRESARRIRALGYFAGVDVNSRPGSSADQVVIDVDVVEANTGSLSFGANFNSDNGFSLVASFHERNFLGRGQAIDFELSTGKTNRVFGFDFTEPQLLGRDLRFNFGIDYRTTDNSNALYDTESFRLSPGLAFPISENGRLTIFYALDYSDITDVAGADTPGDESDDASAVIEAEAALGGLWAN
ncbi:MAG: outer membrane protein assembly factor BamA, partial [Rhodobacteraceae bacterium]|nr:outer membrane protein assembly factor BamA [Paracoccaceae bacterium]